MGRKVTPLTLLILRTFRPTTIRKAKSLGQRFDFLRFQANRDAEQAIGSINGSWVWGQNLLVKVARFLKKQDRIEDNVQFNKQHYLKDIGAERINFREQRRMGDQAIQSKGLRVHAGTDNRTGKGREIVPAQKYQWIQTINPPLKNSGKRGKEIWRVATRNQ